MAWRRTLADTAHMGHDAERLRAFNDALRRFAAGRSDEFVGLDGTRYRRLQGPQGAELERVSADGARARVPFTEDLRRLLLDTARAAAPEDIDALWRERVGSAPEDWDPTPRN